MVSQWIKAEIKGIVYNHHVIFVIACKDSANRAPPGFGQNVFAKESIYLNFAFPEIYTVVVAQLVRASDCGSEGRGFEPHHPPEGARFFVKNFASFFVSPRSCNFSQNGC